jgi:hypothetical protein
VEVELMVLRMEEVIVGVTVMNAIGHEEESTEETGLAIADEKIAIMTDIMAIFFENMLAGICKL